MHTYLAMIAFFITAQHVLQRWKYKTDRDISVVSFGGHRDCKVMKAMIICVSLPTSPNDPLFQELSASVPPIRIYHHGIIGFASTQHLS